MTSLKDLCEGLRDLGCPVQASDLEENREIKRVSFDSRKVEKGDLFCCVPGSHVDGLDFADSAVKSGASALLCALGLERDFGVPVLKVKDVRRAMGPAASVLLGDPSSKMTMAAVTGTNGKSTVTYMIRSIMETRGKAGLLGTIEYHDGIKGVKADRTTPEGPDIQGYLAEMVLNGCHSCVMEASSHGIAQGRLEPIKYSLSVFTNLTPEHLDYHKSMEEYFKTKSLLFEKYTKPFGKMVFNLDDPYGKRLSETHSDQPFTYGIDSENALVRAFNISLGVDGAHFDMKLDKDAFPVHIPFPGKYNVYNALGASAGALALGYSPSEILEGLSKVPRVPGRMERYVFQNGVCAIIDYAHTPDALSNLLKSCREICKGHLISVFGLGGDRFRENRWNMGEIGASAADRLVLTMDNPRSEEPEDIVADILVGVKKTKDPDYEIVIDREKAVARALDQASEGDVVVISGKGPEEFILMKGRKIPYKDVDAVKKWAKTRGLSWR